MRTGATLAVAVFFTGCAWLRPATGPGPTPSPDPAGPPREPRPVEPPLSGPDATAALSASVAAWRAGAWHDARANAERAAGADPRASAFIAGLAELRLGQPQYALERLRAFDGPGAPPVLGLDHEEAELALRAGLADALSATGAAGAARVQWDRLAALPFARPHEVAFARARAQELAGPQPGQQLSVYVPGAGPQQLGLFVPLSGGAQVLGDRLVRAALLAVGAGGAMAAAPSGGISLLVRDAAPDRGPGRSVAELGRDPSVVGIVSVGERETLEQAAREGIPVLALADQIPTAATATAGTTFLALHTAEARAQELARRALAFGVRQFGVLAPDTPAGLRTAEAFRAAVAAGGGRVGPSGSYAAGATSFGNALAPLRRAPVEAVFVPDDAERVELIAPALAAADMPPQPWPAPGAARPPANTSQPGKRRVLLLSTAHRLSAQLVKNAGRYVQGALLAPGFYADPNDPTAAAFAERYRQAFGEDPGLSDAYGYDAVRLLASAVARGARTRSDLLQRLAREPFEGITGTVRFGADRRRSDPPAIYIVEGDAIHRLR